MKKEHYYFDMPIETYNYIIRLGILKESKKEKTILDLMIDAYKWKVMANDCDDDEMKDKYMSVSNTLYDLFMTEHANIGNMFKEE